MVHLKQLGVLIGIISFSFCQPQNFPIKIPTSSSSSEDFIGHDCQMENAIMNNRQLINETLLDFYNSTFPCSCGGVGGWRTRVAYLNMSDTNQQCPSNWRLTTSPVRGCGRLSGNSYTCDSVIYPVNGRTYSSVCGRIIAYQKGVGAAFYRQIHDIEESYVNGVSVTHGVAGSRKHIWTFATAIQQTSGNSARVLIPM